MEDGPAYPYRGVLLDTSRHYLTISSIKDIIRGMGYNKLNRLHLHISDTASFPLEIPSQPNMAAYGAYDEDSLYLTSQIKELVEYAKSYGVVIVPGNSMLFVYVNMYVVYCRCLYMSSCKTMYLKELHHFT